MNHQSTKVFSCPKSSRSDFVPRHLIANSRPGIVGLTARKARNANFVSFVLRATEGLLALARKARGVCKTPCFVPALRAPPLDTRVEA